MEGEARSDVETASELLVAEGRIQCAGNGYGATGGRAGGADGRVAHWSLAQRCRTEEGLAVELCADGRRRWNDDGGTRRSGNAESLEEALRFSPREVNDDAREGVAEVAVWRE